MENIISYKKDDFIITTDKDKVDINKVCIFLSKTYWAKDRERDAIEKSIKNSLCISVLHNDTQIGFARVVTDYITFAYLCDVYMDENYRGNGIGKTMLEFIVGHPELQGLKRFLLVTKDAHEFYKKIGFNKLDNPERFMEILKQQI
ncbi:GNAT family N-acetyltransferase [Clostridium sp. BSD9I1]|uniref:GNAT family N-acetyltransferase n=1 Tax=Clostridium sp. BSD9I1 TaxID=2003589 RepID=UPI001647199E|nr:GNAT family N-acetyltransferase [Clostridium sp. BSD9I1]